MKELQLDFPQVIVVFGIIAILGVMALTYALPQYNTYVTQARVGKALHLGQEYARKIVSKSAGKGGAKAEPDYEYATMIHTGTGRDIRVKITLLDTIDSRIFVDPDDTAGGKILELTPKEASENDHWSCKTDLSFDKRPKNCTYAADVRGSVVWQAKDCIWTTLPDGRNSIICPNFIVTPENFLIIGE